MDITLETPWDGTPDVSARIIVAISRLSTVLRAGIRDFATTENLNPTQAEILQLLAKRTRGVRLNWLANQLSVSPASASDSVATLVTKGLVRKDRAADDGRASALWLTDEGAAAAERLAGALNFADDAVAKLDNEVQEQLLVTLFKLIVQLKHRGRFPALRACPSCCFFETNVFPDSAAPHHCALVRAPLPIRFLRIDCAEHQPAESKVEDYNWAVFA